MTTLRRFSEEELAQALAQIRQDAADSYALAQRAATWLESHTAPLRVSATQKHRFGIYPHLEGLEPCWLAINYCDYDPEPNEWLAARLSPVAASPWGSPHQTRQEKFFILELGQAEGFPEGTKFYCKTSYYDSHSSGF